MASVDRIEIKHPCSASWAAMDGDARARFCRLCSKVVHDTTALTTCELEKMLDAPAPPCLRVHRDATGRVLTRDRLAALAFVGLAACAGGADTARPDTAAPDDGTVVDVMPRMGEPAPEPLVGKIMLPPEPPTMGAPPPHQPAPE